MENYQAWAEEVFEKVKDEIPSNVGVFVPYCGEYYTWLRSVKNAKKQQKRACHGYGRVENKKIPTAKPKRYKKEPVMGMESRRQGKMPAKIKKKADKKESR